MASSGSDAWRKYFQGKGDIKTTVKKISPAYLAEDAMKRAGFDIPAGSEVTYMKADKYESKALVSYKKNNKIEMVRVTFDNLAKPGNKASAAVSLKPQAFGVKEKQYSLQEYKKIVLDHIEDRQDLKAPVKAYLEVLFKYCAGDRTATRAAVTKVFNAVKNDLPLNDINKDFGECAGAIACHTFQLFKPKKITLPATVKIFMPLRPNEPLMDYGLYVGEKQYTISAKSGTTTNTVKPPDILMLLETGKKTRNWKDKPEYKLLKMLAEESILAGPIKAVAATTNLIDESKVATVDKNTKASVFAKFIAQNDYLKSLGREPTVNEVMYECEKLLMARTKAGGDLNMNKIFSDAIMEKVIYVKFELDSAGIPKFEVHAADDINVPTAKRVTLRTKNGYTRASDRMGIQL